MFCTLNSSNLGCLYSFIAYKKSFIDRRNINIQVDGNTSSLSFWNKEDMYKMRKTGSDIQSEFYYCVKTMSVTPYVKLLHWFTCFILVRHNKEVIYRFCAI